jgi:hypothetical protein
VPICQLDEEGKGLEGQEGQYADVLINERMINVSINNMPIIDVTMC